MDSQQQREPYLPLGCASRTIAEEEFCQFSGRQRSVWRWWVVPDPVRVTMVLPSNVWAGLKVAAVEANTTMANLIRAAIDAALLDSRPAVVAGLRRRGGPEGCRTTVDLDDSVYRVLQTRAAAERTSAQAMMLAAICSAYPDMCVGGSL